MGNNFNLTIQDLKYQQLILFECLSGSKAYGLDDTASDVDVKGVFILPRMHFYGLEYTPQIADQRNNVVYYEVGRFVDLLSKSNPTALEMLHTRSSEDLFCHPIFERLLKTGFLSKKCKESFGRFAQSQIHKSKGLNKKIFNPMPRKRKGVLDFCKVFSGKGSVKIDKYLKDNGLDKLSCGFSAIKDVPDMFGLYANENGLNGLVKNDESNDIIPDYAIELRYES